MRTGWWQVWAVGLVVASAFASACARTQPAQPQDWAVEDRIEVIDGQVWVVGARLVSVLPGATIAGTPEVGAMVQLSGQRSRSGELRAERVQVLKSVAQPTAVPVPARTKPTALPAVPAVPAVPTPPAAPNPRAPGRGNDDGDHQDGS